MFDSYADRTSILCVAASGVRFEINGESTNTLTGVDIMPRIVGISHDGDSDC